MAAIGKGNKRCEIEFPPDESVTLVKRFENNRNWALTFLERIGYSKIVPLGNRVGIKDGGFETGGEYLKMKASLDFWGQTQDLSALVLPKNWPSFFLPE